MALTIPRVAPAFTRARAAAHARVASTLARCQRTSRVVRARIGYAAGLLCSAWGVGVLFGFGWALIAGGLAAAWSFLNLYPVDDR